MDDFVIRALIAGLALAAICGPLGCCIIWQRMAFFGEATSHSSILVIALMGLTLIPKTIGLIGLAIGLGIVFWQRQNRLFTNETILAVVTYATLAIGITIMSTLPRAQATIIQSLFGDLLTITESSLLWLLVHIVAIAGVLWWRWHRLINVLINRDLASAANISVKRELLIMIALIASLMLQAIAMVGVLMVSALFIIPAATARLGAHSPESMALLASLAGMLSVGVGLSGSYLLDTPAGPTIIASASGLFIVVVTTSQLARWALRWWIAAKPRK